MAVASGILTMMQRSSWIRAMFEIGIQLKKQYGAENVYDFSLGNTDVDPPESFLRILAEEASVARKGVHGYMPNAGYPDVRSVIADYLTDQHGIAFTERYVLMTCGAGGALNVALKTLLNPGDEVLASVPCFMEYGFYTSNHGGTLKLVPSREDFDLDVDAFEAAISPKTAAVIVNSPNNPSGRVYPESTIAALAVMLERKSAEIGRAIYLISDEPYRRIVYDGVTVPGVFSHYRNTIVATSYSKDLSLPGERIGWLATNPKADDVENLVDGQILCNRILGFVNAPALMQRVVARLQGESVDVGIYRRRRDLLCRSLSEIGYRFTVPQGAFYLFPRAPGGDDVEFVRKLQNERVLAVPGTGFGLPGYFRIAFCVSEDIISRSIDGFRTAFEAV